MDAIDNQIGRYRGGGQKKIHFIQLRQEYADWGDLVIGSKIVIQGFDRQTAVAAPGV